MTREEILEKSRKENTEMDEREQSIALHAASIAKAVGLVLCMLTVMFSRILDADPSAGLGAFAIYWGMYGTERIYRWWHMRKRGDLLAAVGSLAFFLAFAAGFVHVVLNGA